MTTPIDFSKLISDIYYRTVTMNTLDKKVKSVVSSYIESYERLLCERRKIVSKTYGSKKWQAKDEDLKKSMESIRLKAIEVLNN